MRLLSFLVLWAGCTADERCDEELVHVEMLQVSADLLPRHGLEQRSAIRHSAVQRLGDQVTEQAELELKMLPFGVAIVLPHALAFLFAHVFLRRRQSDTDSKATREVLEDMEEGPKSLFYIIERAGPMWLIHMIGIFSWSCGAPSIEYLYLNYFARQNGHPEIDCATQMASPVCAKSVTKILTLQIIRGFWAPLIQFVLGPALGALSDTFGRKPVVLVIRGSLLIATAGTALVAWFPVSIWIDFGLSFFAMIPFSAVPFTWYLDRVDHTPSVVYTMSLVEGSCIICAALGTAVGSLLTLKMALLVEFLGRFLALLLAIFLLPESLAKERRMPFSWSSLVPTAALQVLFQSPVVEKLTAIGMINSFHWQGYYALLTRFLQSHLAWTRQNTYVGGLMEQTSQVLCLALGVNFCLRKFGQTGLMAVSISAAVLSNIVQMLSTKPWHIYLNSLALSGPSIMSGAVMGGIVGKAADPGQQGMLQSALALVYQVAGALGPVAFATVYELLDPTAPGAHSWRMLLYIAYGALFAVPSLFLVHSLHKQVEEGANGDKLSK